jgi:plasmid maintenance system antidote protein VapI
MEKLMLPNEAFVEVIEKYNLNQQELVNKSGVDKGVVSRFINGKSDITSRNLQKLVMALPPQAKAHYYMLYSFENDLNSKLVSKKPTTS